MLILVSDCGIDDVWILWINGEFDLFNVVVRKFVFDVFLVFIVILRLIDFWIWVVIVKVLSVFWFFVGCCINDGRVFWVDCDVDDFNFRVDVEYFFLGMVIVGGFEEFLFFVGWVEMVSSSNVDDVWVCWINNDMINVMCVG